MSLFIMVMVWPPFRRCGNAVAAVCPQRLAGHRRHSCPNLLFDRHGRLQSGPRRQLVGQLLLQHIEPQVLEGEQLRRADDHMLASRSEIVSGVLLPLPVQIAVNVMANIFE